MISNKLSAYHSKLFFYIFTVQSPFRRMPIAHRREDDLQMQHTNLYHDFHVSKRCDALLPTAQSAQPLQRFDASGAVLQIAMR